MRTESVRFSAKQLCIRIKQVLVYDKLRICVLIDVILEIALFVEVIWFVRSGSLFQYFDVSSNRWLIFRRRQISCIGRFESRRWIARGLGAWR